MFVYVTSKNSGYDFGQSLPIICYWEYSLGVFSLDSHYVFLSELYHNSGRHGGLMVSALVPGASGPGSSPGQGHCVVFLGKTLNSHCASLHPGV